MPLYFVAGIFMTVGGALMSTITATTPVGNVYGYSVLVGIGSGLTIQCGYSVATVKVAMNGHPEDVPNAVSLQNVSQVGSTLIALVIAGQIFQSLSFNDMKTVLAGHGFSDSEIRNAITGTQSVVFDTISPELKVKAIGAITNAIAKAWILLIVGGAVSLVSSVFMKRERLFGMTAVAGG
jgi:hypothetical protein